LVAALLLGGAGGYIIRGLAVPTSSMETRPLQRPFVTEQAPYSSPTPSPPAEPTRDPNGFLVPI
jgi:hypothetical protein